MPEPDQKLRELSVNFILPVEDLAFVAEKIKIFWPRKSCFVLTGATGFFGQWICETLAYFEKKYKTENQYFILTRRPEGELLKKIPALSLNNFKVLVQDLSKAFELPNHVDFFLHSANSVGALKAGEELKLQEGLKLTQNSVRAAQLAHVRRFLYVSSGAVYQNCAHAVSENHEVIEAGRIESYAELKRASEKIIESSDLNYAIARCFSFVGPMAAPEMAVMSFLARASVNEKIILCSPEVVRSYMYPRDLVYVLLQMLISGEENLILNVGSAEAISLDKLSRKIAQLSGVDVQIQGSQDTSALAGNYYVPDVSRLQQKIKTSDFLNLDESLKKTYSYLRKN